MATGRKDLRFEQHELGGLLSVAHLFPRSAGRTGIFALNFADRDRYVGQAVDVVGRFAAHRRRWRDITTVEFCRVPPSRLQQTASRWIACRPCYATCSPLPAGHTTTGGSLTG